MKPFYLVWCEETGNTRHRHSTEEDARREAERLAHLEHGRKFYVLLAIASCQENIVSWDEMGNENTSL